MRALKRLIWLLLFIVLVVGIWEQVKYEGIISQMKRNCPTFLQRERRYHTPALVYHIMSLVRPESIRKDNLLSNVLFADCPYVDLPDYSRIYITHVYLTEAEKDALIANYESEKHSTYDPSVERSDRR